MIDPLFPPSPIMAPAIKNLQPLADWWGLSTLPLHIHEVLFAWGCYHLICSVISPTVSRWIFPAVYPHLLPRTKFNWNVHVTSLIQSSFITAFAFYVIWYDNERARMDLVGRIWGYTGAGGAVQAFAAGYFMWDLIVSTRNLKLLGWGSLAHAASALLVTSLGFRPFANYYGLNFVLYEISTPFLNFHWFFDKLDMTGSRIQLYNGIILLATFFGSRVLWGNYQSFRIYTDVWTALHTPNFDSQLVSNNPIFAYRKSASDGFEGFILPHWLAFAYLGSNTVLNFLNIYWFGKMTQALLKRFRTPHPSLGKETTSQKKTV